LASYSRVKDEEINPVKRYRYKAPDLVARPTEVRGRATL
jgi:hypothetical protein